jgi:predicted CopG family antitoxin
VERSADGSHFESIGFVKGNGNSERINSYQFVDFSAFTITASNALYYRLLQVDFDGKESYSDVRKVNQNSELSSEVVAYPNPFENNINLNISQVDKENVWIEVIDLNGQKLLDLSKEIASGNSTVALPEMEGLPSGIYFIKVKSSAFNKVIKVIKH